MKKIEMTVWDYAAFEKAFQHCSDWCGRHQLEIGAAEIALGAGIIALGVHNGAIEMGKDVVGSVMSKFHAGNVVGGGYGTIFGATAGAIIGGIGVVAMGGAIGIPALLVAGGGAVLFGSVGYTVSDVYHNIFNSFDVHKFLVNSSLLVVGIALLLDGARRVIKDKRVIAAASYLKNRVIHLADLAVEIVATTLDDLKDFLRRFKPETPVDAIGSFGSAAAVAAGGAAIGSSIAAGTVTILGSHALGGFALALGLVSAPLWPIIACGGAGLGIGYGVWKSVRLLSSK